MKSRKSSLAALLALLIHFSPANAIPVDLELVLLNDVSGSVSSQDFNSIKLGYANAFRDTGIQAQIQSGEIGSIAISLGFISDNFQLTRDWTLIDSSAAADAFAATLEIMDRPILGDFTANALNIASSINIAADLLGGNNFEGTRNVLSVVTKGAAQDDGCNAFDAYIAVCGVVIEDFTKFSQDIRNKLARDIKPPSEVPLPAAAWMFLTALAGFGVAGWRRRRAGSTRIGPLVCRALLLQGWLEPDGRFVPRVCENSDFGIIILSN